MARVSITVREEMTEQLEIALASMVGWMPTIIDIEGNEVDNPETRKEASRRRLKDLAQNDLNEYTARQAMIAAQEAAAASDNEL